MLMLADCKGPITAFRFAWKYTNATILAEARLHDLHACSILLTFNAFAAIISINWRTGVNGIKILNNPPRLIFWRQLRLTSYLHLPLCVMQSQVCDFLLCSVVASSPLGDFVLHPLWYVNTLHELCRSLKWHLINMIFLTLFLK